MRDDQRRLLDIAEAIERIEKYASKGREAFEGDELIQSWIVHHLQMTGEAARAISSELKDEHSEMPWQQIVGMRNILVHRYFEVDTRPGLVCCRRRHTRTEASGRVNLEGA